MTRSRRFSIAGLMGAVLVGSVAMAALRSGSDTWASATFLVTCGVLGLGFVGVVCGEAADRAWWLGFSTLGAGYLTSAFLVPYRIPIPRGLAGFAPPGHFIVPGFSTEAILHVFVDPGYCFSNVAHCLLCLLAGVLGGASARFLFPPPGRSTVSEDGAAMARPAWTGWYWLGVIGLAGLCLFATIALAGSRTAPGLWPGITVLLTWGLLGLAALGAVLNQGIVRARWLGAALFGIGYLTLISGRFDDLTWPQYATNRLLNAVRARLRFMPNEIFARSDTVAAANLRVLRALDQTVPMHFPKETPLEDVLAHIVAVTRMPDGRAVPIYVDPVGLQQAERTMRSPVSFDLDGVPLRTTLRLLLRQLGMKYEIVGGVISIICESSDEDRDPVYEDPFLLTGQCLLALVAAGLGSLLAPLVIKRGNDSAVVS